MFLLASAAIVFFGCSWHRYADSAYPEPDHFLGPLSQLMVRLMDWICDGLLRKLFIFDIQQYLLAYLF